MKNEKFEMECLKDKEVVKQAGVKIIVQDAARDTLLKGALDNSDYFLRGTELIVGSEVPYLALTLGFFAMEHRANALALKRNNY